MSTKKRLLRHYYKKATVDKRDDFDFFLDENFISWRLVQTKELDEYWENFLKENPHLEKIFREATKQFDAVKINRNQLPEDDKKGLYRAVQLDIAHYKRRRWLRRIGATAAIFAIGILSVLFISRKEGVEQHHPEKDIIVGETLPEEEIYLISGNEKINIAPKSHIELAGNGKVLVTDSTDSEKELLLTTTEINKLVVPYGKRANLTLSDGTKVWLNSGTQLDFPSKFTGDRREISVNGEIFIDVAHNSKIPFIVHAQNIDVQVQGTSFNVSAYHDDNIKTVVLVDGRVKIKTVDNRTTDLLPNEKLEITDNDITKEKVNTSEYISWTKSILEFDETPVSEILKKIGRYYNVHFENSSKIKLNDKTCSGKLFLSNNLDSVMTSVSILSSTVYQRENNIIYITKK
ncbi:MAG: hypothetical protein BGO34_13250 [Bacteroidia bacterium 44-10]|nr:MAG: hypothetical protein BGO34_13250 [Bacteroidia bacterium 44-10]